MTQLIKTIRKGDDFKVVISLKDRNGLPLDVTTAQFKFFYKDVYENSYEVSYDGTVRKNNYIDGEYLVGVFENYKLQCCVLEREEWYWSADASFSDGRWDYGVTRPSGIVLTLHGGLKEAEEVFEVPDTISVNETLVVSKGDKGDRGDRGVKGDKGEDGAKIIEVVNESEAIEMSTGDTKNFYVWGL